MKDLADRTNVEQLVIAFYRAALLDASTVTIRRVKMNGRFFGPGGPACNPGRTDSRDETPSPEGHEVEPRTAQHERAPRRIHSDDTVSAEKLAPTHLKYNR
jgi:hypothetical protein